MAVVYNRHDGSVDVICAGAVESSQRRQCRTRGSVERNRSLVGGVLFLLASHPFCPHHMKGHSFLSGLSQSYALPHSEQISGFLLRE